MEDCLMQYRKNALVNGECYHIFTKSIAGYEIFNSDKEYLRMIALMLFYQIECMPVKFSRFLENEKSGKIYPKLCALVRENERIVEILAYCLMPTHFHVIVKQISKNGISRFMSNILNGYTRYFNLRHNRIGPLWAGRFKSILIDTDEYLKHLTRYIHLNPSTAHLVERPERWFYSSHREYVGMVEKGLHVCEGYDMLDMSCKEYKKFVEERKDYQRDLNKIKHLIIE